MDVEHPQNAETANQFNIKTEVYTGPLDLLIDLIERRKLLVNDISLATVTDDYMQYITTQGERSLRDFADFIVLAATLLLLKSKSLLPILELTEEEEGSVEEFESRLRYYQIFRTSGKVFESLFGRKILYERPYVADRTPLFLPDKYTNLGQITVAISAVIHNLPQKVEKPKVQVRTIVSLEDMMLNLQTRIEKQFSFKFRDFAGNATERSTVIVGFLAVLEMVKQGMILVTQSTRFTDIEIERNGSSVPKYQ